MQNPQPVDPTRDPRFSVRSTETLLKFSVALLTLYLIMRYLPKGVSFGLILLLGVFLATPNGVRLLEEIFNRLRGL
jgi:hypothetical protein